MTYYWILLFCLIISLSSQQRDELVECLLKDLTSNQTQTMSLTEQESLVNRILL